METADFDYDLPASAIAQTPVEPRDAARLLVDGGPGVEPQHRHVTDLPSLVGPGDVVVLNDTSVLNARLRLQKPTGGAAEVLLLEPVPPLPSVRWEALVRPSKKLAPGTELHGPGLTIVVGDDLGEGLRHVDLHPTDGSTVDDAIRRAGEVPLPPYIHAALADPDRYQTTFHEHEGDDDRLDRLRSVAAPTAGLHLTPAVLDAVRATGAQVEIVRLAVGLGTFRPITADRIEDHVMHEERFSVPPAVLSACESAERVIAVGTTVVRALESAAARLEHSGRTDLFIHGDYEFRLVDAMVTNFHVPRSSLLVMIDAFVGPRWRRLYATALVEQYRLLSFGDAMFLLRGRGT